LASRSVFFTLQNIFSIPSRQKAAWIQQPVRMRWRTEGLLYQPIATVSAYYYCVSLLLLYQTIVIVSASCYCINLLSLYQPIVIVSAYCYCISRLLLYQPIITRSPRKLIPSMLPDSDGAQKYQETVNESIKELRLQRLVVR
jgi:hypothetical protein